MHLLIAELPRDFRLVPAFQIAVMPFVERRVALDRQIGLADHGEDDPQRCLGADQHRGEAAVEVIARQQVSGAAGFGDALIA